MNGIIRPATLADASAIFAVHAAAFPSDAEARLVAMLEADDDLVASIVAEIDGEIVAHAAFSRMMVEADGRSLPAVGLAPVGVYPVMQGMRLGTRVICAGLVSARDQRYKISFVLGEPAYYQRFGYSAAFARPYRAPYAGTHFMALHLDERLSTPTEGFAEYAPAFARLARE